MIINNVKYLTLSEYCEAVNAERSNDWSQPISEGAVRTRSLAIRFRPRKSAVSGWWSLVLRGPRKPFANRFPYPNHNPNKKGQS